MCLWSPRAGFFRLFWGFFFFFSNDPATGFNIRCLLSLWLGHLTDQKTHFQQQLNLTLAHVRNVNPIMPHSGCRFVGMCLPPPTTRQLVLILISVSRSCKRIVIRHSCDRFYRFWPCLQKCAHVLQPSFTQIFEQPPVFATFCVWPTESHKVICYLLFLSLQINLSYFHR